MHSAGAVKTGTDTVDLTKEHASFLCQRLHGLILCRLLVAVRQLHC